MVLDDERDTSLFGIRQTLQNTFGGQLDAIFYRQLRSSLSAQDATELASHHGRHINPIALFCNLILAKLTIRMSKVW